MSAPSLSLVQSSLSRTNSAMQMGALGRKTTQSVKMFLFKLLYSKCIRCFSQARHMVHSTNQCQNFYVMYYILFEITRYFLVFGKHWYLEVVNANILIIDTSVYNTPLYIVYCVYCI